jgi:hypothetical protein
VTCKDWGVFTYVHGLKGPRKVAVLFTLHRRYDQLWENLLGLKERVGEFSEPPLVAVVAAQPEPAALPFLRRLQADGLVDWLLFRPADGTDGAATTAPESRNVRLGLAWARDVLGPDGYGLVQAADVTPNPGTYKLVDERMRAGLAGCVFHWANGSARSDVWHTNFFAVGLSDESLWPPVANPGDPDVLERQWGRLLGDRSYGGLEWWKTHNSDEKRFVHVHKDNGPPPAVDTPPPPPARGKRRRRWYLLWLA